MLNHQGIHMAATVKPSPFAPKSLPQMPVIDGVGAVDGRKSDGMGGVGSVGLSAGSALLTCVAFSVGAALGLEAALWLGEALSAGVTLGLGAVPSVAGRWGDSA